MGGSVKFGGCLEGLELAILGGGSGSGEKGLLLGGRERLEGVGSLEGGGEDFGFVHADDDDGDWLRKGEVDGRFGIDSAGSKNRTSAEGFHGEHADALVVADGTTSFRNERK